MKKRNNFKYNINICYFHFPCSLNQCTTNYFNDLLKLGPNTVYCRTESTVIRWKNMYNRTTSKTFSYHYKMMQFAIYMPTKVRALLKFFLRFSLKISPNMEKYQFYFALKHVALTNMLRIMILYIWKWGFCFENFEKKMNPKYIDILNSTDQHYDKYKNLYIVYVFKQKKELQ